MYLAVRHALRPARGVQGGADAARRSRRRQHQPDAAAPRTAEPLGRLRARRGAAAPAARSAPPHATTCRWRCSSATSPTSIEEIRRRDPARPHHAHDRDRRRRAVRGVADPRQRRRRRRPRDPARRVSRVLRRDRAAGRGRPGRSIPPAGGRGRDAGAGAARLPHAAGRDRRRAALVVVGRVAARRRAARRRRAEEPADRRGLRAAGAGQRRGARPPVPLRSRPRPSRRACSRRGCSTSCATSTGSAIASGCCCRWPALLHDIGIYVSLRAHHKHSQYILAASQIFGLSERGDRDRLEHRALPPPRRCRRTAICRYIALDRTDRLIVNKLGGDSAPGQRARRRARCRRCGTSGWCGATSAWILELDGDGDLTMEQMAATARADMFAEIYGRQLVDPAGGSRRVKPPRRRSLFINRELSWLGVQRARARGGGRSVDAAARARQVRGDRRVEPRRVLHGAGRRGSSARSRTATPTPDPGRPDARRSSWRPSASARTRSSPRSTGWCTTSCCRRWPTHGIRLVPWRTLDDGAGARRSAAFFRGRGPAGADAAGDRRVAAVSAARRRSA